MIKIDLYENSDINQKDIQHTDKNVFHFTQDS
jgi:hypothetical protein